MSEHPHTTPRYVFIGGTFRGLKVLEALASSGVPPLLAYILREDPHEQEKWSPELEACCTAMGIPSKTAKRLTQEDYAQINSLGELDFIAVCGWRSLLEPSLGLQARYGMLAAHDSLLPAYRGFAPLNWAIINGEAETGVSLFQITEGETDSGPIFAQKRVAISPDALAGEVFQGVTAATVELYTEFLTALRNNQVQFYEQDHALASYTCKRTPEDGQVDWQQPSSTVWNLVRALAPPYPCAFCHYKDEVFRITKARLGNRNAMRYVGGVPGRVIAHGPQGVEVLCRTGSLLIEEWVPAGTQVPENPSERIKSIAVTLY